MGEIIPVLLTSQNHYDNISFVSHTLYINMRLSSSLVESIRSIFDENMPADFVKFGDIVTGKVEQNIGTI